MMGSPKKKRAAFGQPSVFVLGVTAYPEFEAEAIARARIEPAHRSRAEVPAEGSMSCGRPGQNKSAYAAAARSRLSAGLDTASASRQLQQWARCEAWAFRSASVPAVESLRRGRSDRHRQAAAPCV